MTSRLWYLPKGHHLCGKYVVGELMNPRPWGTAGDEYGHKTWWLRLPTGGVIVWASKKIYYPECLEE